MTDDQGEQSKPQRLSPITRRIINTSAAIALEDIEDIERAQGFGGDRGAIRSH